MEKSEEKTISHEELQKLHDAIKKMVKKSDLCMVDERIAAYLNMLGVKFEKSEQINGFVIPLSIKIKDKEYRHLIIIRTVGPWLIISVGIMSADEIPPAKRDDLYRELLKANHKYPEFSYDMDDDGNIGYTEDIFIPALTFDVFAEEFLSIPAAVKYFWEKIIPSLGDSQSPKKTDFYYT